MLKKVALVAAASAASVVAVSPLAFASDSHETGIDKSGKGLINVSGNNANVPVQACNNDVPPPATRCADAFPALHPEARPVHGPGFRHSGQRRPEKIIRSRE